MNRYPTRLVLAATLSAVFSIGVAAAVEPAPAASPAPAAVAAPPAKADPNQRICKTAPVIGRRVPSRTCMTRAEWEERARIDRQDLEAAQRSGLAVCGTKPCN
ncbi:MAG: hypothetical protein Q7T19_05610 [Caulobacter sp.]|nr:hypothetical protein [Caulobacter sp.]